MEGHTKLTDRIARLEDIYMNLKTSIQQVVEPVSTEAEAEADVAVVLSSSASCPATNTATNTTATPSEDHGVSLFHLLTSTTASSAYTKKENELLQTYIKYVQTFLETHVLETSDEVKIDYRLIALTLEFITAAKKDICLLAGVDTLTMEVVCTGCVWFLNVYKAHTPSARIAIPHNIELLINTMYDIRNDKYVFNLIKAEEPEPKKIKKTFLSRSKMRFSTMRHRWVSREDPGCLPS